MLAIAVSLSAFTPVTTTAVDLGTYDAHVSGSQVSSMMDMLPPVTSNDCDGLPACWMAPAFANIPAVTPFASQCGWLCKLIIEKIIEEIIKKSGTPDGKDGEEGADPNLVAALQACVTAGGKPSTHILPSGEIKVDCN